MFFRMNWFCSGTGSTIMPQTVPMHSANKQYWLVDVIGTKERPKGEPRIRVV